MSIIPLTNEDINSLSINICDSIRHLNKIYNY
jgi:hypothetical protein